MHEITMPRLADSMEEGTIYRWLAREGQIISEGDEIVEIETDKAVVAHAADESGSLRIVVAEGARCAVGAVIALLEETNLASLTTEREPPPGVNNEAEILPTHTSVAAERPPAAEATSLKLIATPVARRTAQLHDIDLRGVSGSGPRGRITRDDVLREAGAAIDDRHHRSQSPDPERPVAQRDLTIALPEKGDLRSQPLSRLQQVIAKRMADAKATVPHFQVQAEAAVDDLLDFRAAVLAAEDDGPRVTMSDLIIKAVAGALTEHPLANGTFAGDHFESYSRVNVGFAVALDEGLIVPTVMDADEASIGEIATETRRLTERAKSGTLTPQELSGATFTVSNLGMLGMTAIFPVVNPPNAAILGVGSARQLLAHDATGKVVSRSIMTLTLSCDHRILYGADAARFLNSIKCRLENPLRLVL